MKKGKRIFSSSVSLLTVMSLSSALPLSNAFAVSNDTVISASGIMKTEGDTDDVVDTGDVADTDDTVGTDDAADAGDAAGTDDAGDAAGTDDAGDAAGTDDAGDAAGTDDAGDAAGTDDAGDAADTGDAVDTVTAIFGDVNGDGLSDAADASAVLAEYAATSTGHESTFTDSQKKLADVNFDETIDASDASRILQFYAYVMTGGEHADMEEWIEEVLGEEIPKEPVEEPTEALTGEDDEEEQIDTEFFLRTDKNAIFTNDNNGLKVYLETSYDLESVSLWYGKENDLTNTVEMYDNGKNADDIEGDGIYSVSINISDITEDTVIHFVAKSEENVSNDVAVSYYLPTSDEAFEAMEVVDKGIDDLLNNPTYIDKTESNKLSMIKEMLAGFVKDGYIKEDTIYVDENNCLVSFMYIDDILGGVSYGELDSEQNGISSGIDARDNGLNVSVPVISDTQLFNDDAEDEKKIGKAVILNSFPAFETKQSKINYRTGFYEKLEKSWDKAGLDTTLIVDPTVKDYQKLEDYNVICISTHGTRYSWYDGSYHEFSAICLAEKHTDAKNEDYDILLRDNQIAKVNGKYYILPSFFEKQYDPSAFSTSFIFSECCQALGKGEGSNSAKYDYAMANAFTSRSAKGYIGFHNTVWADYSRELMEEYVNSLIKGDTSKQSYDNAVKKMGANHEIWWNNTHFTSHASYYPKKENPEVYDPLVHIAYPVLRGKENAVLVSKGILNGDFEKYSIISTKPKYWNCLGDIRTIKKLGEILPYGESSKRMAIITSGIGAKQSAKFENGTEGSNLSQSFAVPDNATTITFDYNFVSEEPMEYVGSKYDDSFVVQLSKGGVVNYNNTFESINTSEWKEVSGVNFVSGDNTAFQTGWKSATIDVSAYRGEVITISFIIYDVGDTLYDSACLIDNVEVK